MRYRRRFKKSFRRGRRSRKGRVSLRRGIRIGHRM